VSVDPRRRLTAAARREQLLDACAAVVDTEGFAAVSIDRVATACGVSRTVVYQQFGGLDGMLDALVARSTERAAHALVATQDTGREPSPRDAMARVLDAVDADPATWRMFLVAPQLGPASLTDNLAAGRALIRAKNEGALDRHSDSPITDPELTARVLQAVADELVRLRLADPSLYTTERILDQVEWLAGALLGRADDGPGGSERGAEVTTR
jgi:AcrR family transcriptional regulator